MKIAVLWMGLSGYLNACLKELAGRDQIELFVCYRVPDPAAPYNDEQFDWMANRFKWSSDHDLEPLAKKLRAFGPDILIFSGWGVPAYRRAAKEFGEKCWRVMAIDRCWLDTPKQRIGVVIAPFFIRPLADAIWVPGERQAVFARKLGFNHRCILRGLYSCDQPAASMIHSARISEGRAVPHSFLFIGRFVPDKCIDLLAHAYRLYRRTSPNPWPLVCCGLGPMRFQLDNQEGIRLEGFVQPERMPDILSSAGCLILPSRFEPWGLVVHEAASAGKVILASESVGAVTHLVQPGFNGFIFDSNDINGAAELMCRVAAMSDTDLEEMSRASHLLSQQFSPGQWASTLIGAFHARIPAAQLHNLSALPD